MKKRSLLLSCLLASLSLHVFFLIFLYKNPLHIKNQFSSLFRKSTPPLQEIREEEIAKREEELEEALKEFATPTLNEVPYDMRFQVETTTSLPGVEEIDLSSAVSTEELSLPRIKEEKTLPQKVALAEERAKGIEEIEFTDGFVTQLETEQKSGTDSEELITAADLTIDEMEEEIEAERTSAFTSLPVAVAVETEETPVDVLESFAHPFLAEEAPDRSMLGELKTRPTPKQKLLLPASLNALDSPHLPFEPEIEIANLDAYLLPEIAEGLDWDNQFEIKVELMSQPINQPGSQGHVFSLRLYPNDELELQAIPQNFYFIIDRSNSIEKFRFGIFKRAVLKALSCLQSGDKFNIILFDKKIIKLSEETLPFSRASIQKAEDFLDQQQGGGAFAAADLYTLLPRIVPAPENEDEVHTAILITDGNSSLSPRRQKLRISEWIEQNKGKVSLYTAAVGKENNLLLLDLLSTYNGGYLLYSDTHAAFPRKLGKLVLNLHGPLLKDVTISATPKDPETEILFYPTSAHLPTFYQKSPYELLGTTDALSDFTLLIQGRYKDQWVVIKKEIQFKRAARNHTVSRQIEKRWKNQMAKGEYAHFLENGKAAHLLKAKELFKAAGNEIALQ